MRALWEVYEGQAASARVSEPSEHWSGPPGMVERIAGVVGTRADHVVLDVGAGVGGPARRLARLVGCRVLAVDLLPEVVARGARRAVHENRVAFAAGSAASLPVRSGAADQLWSLGMVGHVPDIDAFCSEAIRVVRPGGAVALTEALWDGRRDPRFSGSAPFPWRALAPEWLVAALRGAGFASVRVLPWPGHRLPGSGPPSHPALAADLADGRLVPRLLVARRP
jgi:sarcosine/dimethylglycine N-methyltransferase